MPLRDEFNVRNRSLARTLAAQAHALQRTVIESLEVHREQGPLPALYDAFRNRILGLTVPAFSEACAQILTFGLLMAKWAYSKYNSEPGECFTRHHARLCLVTTNPLLDHLFDAGLGGGNEAPEGTLLRAMEGLVEVLNHPDLAPFFDAEDGRPGDTLDRILRFYELFLAAHDRTLKNRRGVFFTPKPVVSFIVGSTHDLLRREFGLEDGLASTDTWGEVAQRQEDLELPEGVRPSDPFVCILDPATGAGPFLLECVEVIERTMKNRWCRELGTEDWQDPRVTARWGEYVSLHLLPRLHGYELMTASWAIAHLGLAFKLRATGVSPGSDRPLSLHPVNALEPSTAPDACRAKPFTVILGNPPYAGLSANLSDEANRLVEPYKIVDGAALGERKHWLHDDYVKFFRVAQQITGRTGAGILGFITNHGYLGNPTFRGMRQSLLDTYPRITILDLHGNATRKERGPDDTGDHNVFDIRQGVSIFLGRRLKGPQFLQHAELRGTRERKNRLLSTRTVLDFPLEPLHPDGPFYLFVPQDVALRTEYLSGWRIPDIFPVHSAGFITARDRFATDPEEEALRARIAEFADPELPDETLRARYFAGRGAEKYPAGDTRGWKMPDARRQLQQDPSWQDRIQVCLYRPFDTRFVYWTEGMVDWPRPRISGHLLLGANRALLTARSNKSGVADHFFCSRWISEAKCAESSTQSTVFPLYLFSPMPGNAHDGPLRRPNLSPDFLKAFSRTLGPWPTPPGGLPEPVTPEDLFDYAYAVFYSPGYRSRYEAFLRLDFPRLPLIRSRELFGTLTRLGAELVSLHLLEADALDQPGVQFFGHGRAITRVGWTGAGGGTVLIHEPRGGTGPNSDARGFYPVPEDVWNFHIGGYRVCEKWLKDRRGRSLTDGDIDHYRKIVRALTQTVRIMRAIDDAIAGHGGWPAAFGPTPPAG